MAKFAINASGAMLLPSLVRVSESISGSVVPLAMFYMDGLPKYSRQTGFWRKLIYRSFQVGVEAEISEAPFGHPYPPHPRHHGTPCDEMGKPISQCI